MFGRVLPKLDRCSVICAMIVRPRSQLAREDLGSNAGYETYSTVNAILRYKRCLQPLIMETDGKMIMDFEKDWRIQVSRSSGKYISTCISIMHWNDLDGEQ